MKQKDLISEKVTVEESLERVGAAKPKMEQARKTLADIDRPDAMIRCVRNIKCICREVERDTAWDIESRRRERPIKESSTSLACQCRHIGTNDNCADFVVGGIRNI